MPGKAKVDPRWFKQAQRGLYDGKTRVTGNNVSASKRHTRRHWLPNVQRSHPWSDIMQRTMSLNVTTGALRQIDRVGGFDNYVLNTPDLGSVLGEKIKRQLLSKLKLSETIARKEEVRRIRKLYNEATPEQQSQIEATLRAQLMGGQRMDVAAQPPVAELR